MRSLLPAGLIGLGLLGCASTDVEPPSDSPILAPATHATDLVQRIASQLARGSDESASAVMNSLEHLMGTWVSEQRLVRELPLENVLTQKVVVAFDHVAQMFRSGPHERKLVAAWALGFSRVPDNDLGVESRHDEALELLLEALPSVPDDVLRNILLSIWKLGDPATPVTTLTEIVVQHHDSMVRAMATLALSTVLRPDTAPIATHALLVALGDSEERVRLHAARAAIVHPEPALTLRIESQLLSEDMPFVQAAMARALGAAGEPSSAAVLIALLGDPREVIAGRAHAALVDIFQQDMGPAAQDWFPLVR
jgi:hypothetical protein